MTRDEIIRRLEEAFASSDPDNDVDPALFKAWIETFADAAEALPMPEVPPVLRRELRDLPRRLASRQSYTAALTRDSRGQAELVGARGGEAVDEGWTLTYSCPLEDVGIDVVPVPGAGLDVEGQVLRHSGDMIPVQITLIGEPPRTFHGDALGRFQLGPLAPDSYRVLIDDGSAEVEITLDLGDGG